MSLWSDGRGMEGGSGKTRPSCKNEEIGSQRRKAAVAGVIVVGMGGAAALTVVSVVVVVRVAVQVIKAW